MTIFNFSLQETVALVDEIGSFKMKIYEKSERQENIMQNDLDRLVKDAVARPVLEAKKIKLFNRKSIPLTDSASFLSKN